MKRLLLINFLLLLSSQGYSQARIVLNDNAHVNIENDAFLVIDNSNANAITLAGSGGNIYSNGEKNVVKWNIRNATGNYNLPFTNESSVKIPVEMDINSTGDVNGDIIFSTYRTTDYMNTPWPQVAPVVTNMCSPFYATDASKFVVDRFWRIDANSYSSKPGATLSFGYDFANEAGGNNTITEGNLQAQRFNPSPSVGTPGTSCDGTNNVTGNWEMMLFGTANTSANKVNSAVVSPNNLLKDWILVDNSTPLPISLLNFDTACKNGLAVLNWSTATENNNDYFVIEKSTDGVNFNQIATIDGEGNSNSKVNYMYRDQSINTNTAYYRLSQVDFDGKKETFDIISSHCASDNDFIVNQEKFGDNTLHFYVHTTDREALTVSLYDYNGRLISSKKTSVKEGSNKMKLKAQNLVKGIYMLNIVGEKNQYANKLFKK